MTELTAHGKRLSAGEYERRVVVLQEDLPSHPSRQDQRRLQRMELDLAIDHRLGEDFPEDKRDAIWEIRKSVRARRGRLLFRYLSSRLFQQSLESGSNDLANLLLSEYSTVLDEEELSAFFGGEHAANQDPPDQSRP